MSRKKIVNEKIEHLQTKIDQLKKRLEVCRDNPVKAKFLQQQIDDLSIELFDAKDAL